MSNDSPLIYILYSIGIAVFIITVSYLKAKGGVL